jgi:hypothetical protein
MFEQTAIADPLETFRFSLSGDFSGQFCVAGGRVGEDGEHVVFNLPTYSTSVFIALSDDSPLNTGLILANLEDHERESGAQLALGEVVIIPRGAAQPIAPYAVLLLRTATLADVARVPDRAEIAGHPTTFFLAVPLTKAEYDYRAEHGHDALLDLLETENKSLAF